MTCKVSIPPTVISYESRIVTFVCDFLLVSTPMSVKGQLRSSANRIASSSSIFSM